MKKIRRLHLYLGCFFTPLLFLYIFTGFLLTRETGTLKGANDAETFMQKLSSLHMRQFYPMQREGLPVAELRSADPETDILTVAEPLQYANGTPVKLTGLDLPAGLDTHITYHIQTKGSKTLTLHANKETENPIDLRPSKIGENIELNPEDDDNHNATRIVGFDPDSDTLTTETPHNYLDGLTISRVSGIGCPPGLRDLHTYYTHVIDEKTITLHESPDDATPVDLQAFTYTYENVSLNPTVRTVITNNTKWFKWLVYAMTLGVLVTMALGVVLALRNTKDKWPVLASLGAGLLAPVLLLWIGISQDTITDETSAAPESPGKSEPNAPKDIQKGIPSEPPKNFPKDLPKDLPNDFPKDLPKDLPKELPKNLPGLPPGK